MTQKEMKELSTSNENEEVMKTVLGRKHVLEGTQLEVKEYIPPPPPKPRPLYDDKVLVKHMNPDTTKDSLENFLETEAGVSLKDCQYGDVDDTGATALVTFTEPPDFKKLELAFMKRSLDKLYLKVFRVPISNCIKVTGAGEKTSLSTLELYFENGKRSGGGDVTEVKELEDGSCLVYFEDHTVIEEVCKRSHTVDGQKLSVHLYHELLGDNVDGEEGPKFKIPDPIVLSHLDPRKVQFFMNSKPNKDGLEQKLKSKHAKVNWPDRYVDPIKMECLLTKDMKDCRSLAKTWKTATKESLDRYFDVLMVQRHQVLQDAWTYVIEELKQMNISHPNGVTVAVEKVSFEIYVMGHKKIVSEVSGQIEKIIGDIAEELERKKKQVKETTSPIKHHQVIMLSHKHYVENMEKKYSGMKVKVDFKARQFTFEGMCGDVTKAKLEMYEIINGIVSSEVTSFSKGRYRYLENKEVKSYVAGKMKDENIVAVWEMQDDRLYVYAMSDEEAVRAAHILKNSIMETTVDVQPESSPLLTSEMWLSEEKSIRDNCQCVIDLQLHLRKPCIVVYSTDTDAEMVRERITDFLKFNTVYETSLPVSSGMFRYIQEHCKDEIQKIQKSLVNDQVSINTDNMAGIVIKGTEVGLRKAKQLIGQLVENIEKKEHILKKPGIAKLMMSDTGQEKVSKVERSIKAVMVPSDESESSDEDNIKQELGLPLVVKNPDVAEKTGVGPKNVEAAELVHPQPTGLGDLGQFRAAEGLDKADSQTITESKIRRRDDKDYILRCDDDEDDGGELWEVNTEVFVENYPEKINVIQRLKPEAKSKSKTVIRKSSHAVIEMKTLADNERWQFVLTSDKIMSDINVELETTKSEVTFDDEYNILKVVYHSLRELPNTIQKSTMNVLEKHLDMVDAFLLQPSDVAHCMKYLQNHVTVKNEEVSIYGSSTGKRIMLVGLVSDVQNLVFEVLLQFPRQTVTRASANEEQFILELVKQNDIQLQLFTNFHCDQLLTKAQPGILMKFGKPCKEICIFGPTDSVRKVVAILCEDDWPSKLLVFHQVSLSKPVMTLLHDEPTRTYLQFRLKMFQKDKVFEWKIVLDKSIIELLTKDDATVRALEHIIRTSIVDRCVRVKNPQACRNLIDEFTKKQPEKMLVYYPAPSGSEITFYGPTDVFSRPDFSTLLSKIKEHPGEPNPQTLLARKVTLDEKEYKFFMEEKLTAMIKVLEDLDVRVSVLPQGSQQVFLTSSNEQHLTRAATLVQLAAAECKIDFKGAQDLRDQ